MEVEINYLAVLLAALSSFLVGMVWYAKPLFGNAWSKMVGMTDEKAKQGMMPAMMKAFVAALVMAYVLAHVTYISATFFNVSFMESALNTAFWLWLGVSLTTLVVHDSFEQRPMKLTAMNAGNQLVTMLAMGVIIGLLKV
jgi:hypothetical protein